MLINDKARLERDMIRKINIVKSEKGFISESLYSIAKYQCVVLVTFYINFCCEIWLAFWGLCFLAFATLPVL